MGQGVGQGVRVVEAAKAGKALERALAELAFHIWPTDNGSVEATAARYAALRADGTFTRTHAYWHYLPDIGGEDTGDAGGEEVATGERTETGEGVDTGEGAGGSHAARHMAQAMSFARTIAVLDPKTRAPLQRLTILALREVCSHPEARGRGFGKAVVRSAFARVDEGAFPFSLFQTSRKNQGFYEKLGARRIEARIVNSRAPEDPDDRMGGDPEANPFWDEIAMVYPAATPWPEGTIDLLGPGY